MTEPREHFIESQGLPIHYLEWGVPKGAPLVLVHGYLDLAYSWRCFVNALQQRQNRDLWIVAPDCRGHGDSGWVGAGGYYHFPDYVLDLEGVVRALGAERINLIGHSMGGTVSFLYSGAHPDRVEKLVLIEGIGPIGMEFTDAPLRMAKWIGEVHDRGRNHFRTYTSVEAGAQQLQLTNRRLGNTFALELAHAAMKQNDNGKWVWKFDPLHRTIAPQPFYTAQALEFFRRIQCPVLIVDGKESRQIRRTDKQQRYNAIAHRQFATIAAAGHMVHHDQPESLAETVANFLAP